MSEAFYERTRRKVFHLPNKLKTFENKKKIKPTIDFLRNFET